MKRTLAIALLTVLSWSAPASGQDLTTGDAQLNASILIVLVVLAGTVFMLVSEVVRSDVAAMLCLLALAWSDVVGRARAARSAIRLFQQRSGRHDGGHDHISRPASD